MKKIFAILVSLLFVVSVFGVASLTAEDVCQCDGNDIIVQTNAQVGDSFIYKAKCGATITVVGGGIVSDYIKVENLPDEGDYDNVFMLKALKLGTLKICPTTCCSESTCRTLTITPKEYPVFSFMKMLGFGKKK